MRTTLYAVHTEPCPYCTSGTRSVPRRRGSRLFNRFAPAREQAGVQQTEVFQPSDNPNYIVVNLRFESVDAATNFRTFLHNVVWQSPRHPPRLSGRRRLECSPR
jgi:hypothetical protein